MAIVGRDREQAELATALEQGLPDVDADGWNALFAPAGTPDAIIRKAPSAAHWFGTDEIGRDVLARVVWGARASLLAGVVSVLISLSIGVPVGLLAGYAGRSARQLETWRDSEALYRNAIAVEPNNVTVLNNLAWALNELGDPKAIDYAERAATLAPQDAVPPYYAALAWSEVGDLKRQAVEFEIVDGPKGPQAGNVSKPS